MSGRRGVFISLALLLLLFTGSVNTVSALTEGYVLSAAFMSDTTDLFDKDGNIIFKWVHTIIDTIIDSSRTPPRVTTSKVSATCGYSCYLLENGNLLRSCSRPGLRVGDGAAPVNGVIQEVDLDGTILWEDTIADVDQSLHHDFKPIKKPDGSYNVLAVSFVTATKEVAVAAGVDSAVFGTGMMQRKSFQAEKIIEIKPDLTGAGNSEIVWQWHILDHVASKDNVLAHPELFDGTHPTWPAFPAQWVHLNGIDYSAEKDLVLFSSRVFSEVYVIDHSTSTEEARGSTGGNYGKGGGLLYRWGHPSNYIMEFIDSMIITPERITVRRGDTTITPAETTIVTKRLGHEGDLVNCLHCPTWIPEGYRNAGNILFFHNNADANMKQVGCSQAVEINPWDAEGALNTLTAGSPAAPLPATWVYESTDSMYSASMSSAIRMKSGNTLVHEAYPGGNQSGLSSTIREVDPSGQMVGEKIILKKEKGYNPAKIMYYAEDYPGIIAILNKIKQAVKTQGGSRLAMPIRPIISLHAGRIAFSNVAGAEIAVYSLQGKRVVTLQPSTRTAVASLPAGTYLVKMRLSGRETVHRVMTAMR
ncbi:MAG: aryl-sulfate sulfotransferase [Chitinispirillaceae bacterium]|nr:aryl-sulfate sulfotransferase [Chitinispirillaceae bacterium]